MWQYAIIASVLACLSPVSGHGGGHKYIIDGATHSGNWERITNKVDSSIQRQWNWDAFVDPNNPKIACGDTGRTHPNTYHAPTKAGSTISINYTTTEWSSNGEAVFWGHDIGPMMAYMAACPDEGCDNVDVNAPIWFKIWDAGLLSGTWLDGLWAMKVVWEGNNLDIPTPASLKPGKYLFRHEMINPISGGLQAFANCIHLDVSGSGSSIPATEELVSFPGAYEKDDGKSFASNRGSEWFWTEHGQDTFYPIPGPPVWEG